MFAVPILFHELVLVQSVGIVRDMPLTVTVVPDAVVTLDSFATWITVDLVAGAAAFCAVGELVGGVAAAVPPQAALMVTASTASARTCFR